MRISTAIIDYATVENDDGIEVDCVIATCNESGVGTEPVWGQHDASIKRALATLTSQCSCGAQFHREGQP